MKKRFLGLALLSGLILTGCTSETANLQGEVEAVSAAKEELVVSLNDIQAKETELQAQFDESMAADAELATFSDGTAAVFANIEGRKETLDSISTIMETIQDEYEDLQEIDEETLPLAEVATLTSTIEEMDALLESYLTAYESQLTTEEEIYQSLGGEEADFNTLYEGVDQVNEVSAENLESLRPLIELFNQFDTQVDEILALLATEEE